MNYAIITSDTILEIKSLGNKRNDRISKSSLNDRFRIGSNTKTITSYIAFILVKEKKINWETKFFDLFPELKATSKKTYKDLTLRDLITFRANLISWTYTNEFPAENQIKGNEKEQRYEFSKWVLKQKPMKEKKEYYFSNPSYVLAGLMLEKASGKSYELLVKELGDKLNVNFEFGQPNLLDSNDTWGHNEFGNPESPNYNYKLNWLSSAGNINVSLSDYVKFIQIQLNGLQGNLDIFSKEEFENMHYGLPRFSYGWNWLIDAESNLKYSYHRGNPGTFLSEVTIFPSRDLAFIFFLNIQSEDAEKALDVLFDEMVKRFVNN